jgi:hypothetical protein
MPDSQPVYGEADVDDPARLVRMTRPQVYPRDMMASGVDDRIVVLFVIDTIGVIVPQSLTVIQASNNAFIAPGKEFILGAQFRPAVRQNRRVPVCVQQTINWRVT